MSNTIENEPWCSQLAVYWYLSVYFPTCKYIHYRTTWVYRDILSTACIDTFVSIPQYWRLTFFQE